MTNLVSKSEAKKLLTAAGYVFYSFGESGDYGFKSREYWWKAGSEKNAYGFPLNTAWMSKVRGGWIVSL